MQISHTMTVNTETIGVSKVLANALYQLLSAGDVQVS